MDNVDIPVTVIISTYSDERLNILNKCIESLRNQTRPPKEIILVLDSDEKLLEYYRLNMSSDIKIIDSGGQGLSTARNAGIISASSDVVAFIDDDAYADKEWLQNLVKHYEDPNVIATGGAVIPLWENKRPSWFAEELDWIIGCTYKGYPESISSVRNPIGCNMSFRKNIFEKVGYFKTDIGRYKKKLLSGEEMEISHRALKIIPNSDIIYDPSSKVHHMVTLNRTNLRYVLKRSYYEGYSKAFISDNDPNTLKTENNYLSFLLKKAIPQRIKKIYKINNMLQLITITLSIMSVGSGFLLGKVEKKIKNR